VTAPEPVDLAAVRALADAATRGPWEVPVANVFRVIAPSATHTNERQGLTPPYPWLVVADMGDPDGNARDARFIAAARTLVPALCDGVERLRAEVADLAQGDAVVLENDRLRDQLAESVPRSALVQVGWTGSDDARQEEGAEYGYFTCVPFSAAGVRDYTEPVYVMREDETTNNERGTP